MPLLRLSKSIRNHVYRSHNRSLADYARDFGLEETEEERRVKEAASNLLCSECGETLRGFQQILDHTGDHYAQKDSEHKQPSLHAVLGELSSHLGILNCSLCKGKKGCFGVLSETWPLHRAYFHKSEKKRAPKSRWGGYVDDEGETEVDGGMVVKEEAVKEKAFACAPKRHRISHEESRRQVQGFFLIKNT